MKKVLAIVLALVMCLSLTMISSAETTSVKFGLITLHDEESTYDRNFIESAKRAVENMGLSVDDDLVIISGIDESNACYEAAVELVETEGCNFVFADSFGHETFLMQAAAEYPEVTFAHATGDHAHTADLANFSNAFAAIYEGRYLAGVAAGMKLEELRAAGQLKGEAPMMGYVGAFTYAEVISGFTSFYLGAKSICPDVTMKVQFTGSWYDPVEEKAAAEALIAAGCDLISQHADSMGAPTACENAGIPNISYNGSTVESCPKTFIVSSLIDWAPYFEYMMTSIQNGTEIGKDWTGTLATGSVALTDVNEAAAAAGTVEKLAEVKAALMNGEIKVFDTTTFTVGGAELTEYMANVDFDAAFTPDTQVVMDGYFAESYFRSAPYFDLTIDGIELLNVAF